MADESKDELELEGELEIDDPDAKEAADLQAYYDALLDQEEEPLEPLEPVPDPLIELRKPTRAVKYEDYQTYQLMDAKKTSALITDLSTRLLEMDPFSVVDLYKLIKSGGGFGGAGIYAFYYIGDLPIYQSIGLMPQICPSIWGSQP
jgi:hypothetical protein